MMAVVSGEISPNRPNLRREFSAVDNRDGRSKKQGSARNKQKPKKMRAGRSGGGSRRIVQDREGRKSTC
jgi:hypothetical protein